MSRIARGPLQPSVEEGQKLYQLMQECLGTNEPDEATRYATVSPSYTKALYYAHSNLRNHSVVSPRLFEALGIGVAEELHCPFLAARQKRCLERLLSGEEFLQFEERGAEADFLEPAEKQVLSLVPRFVHRPETFTDQDFQELRQAGYRDSEILEILATLGMFVMQSTVISGLGLR